MSRNKPNKVFNIELPGDTRVSGTQKLQQQLLRSFWTLKTYFALEADTDSEPAPNDWVTAAEFEAIMRPIARLAINVQTDQLTLSSSFLRQLECQIELNQDTYDIVDRTKRGRRAPLLKIFLRGLPGLRTWGLLHRSL